MEERWGSLGNLTSSVATRRSAHANAHLHAIRDRKSRRSEGDAADDNSGTGTRTGGDREPPERSSSHAERRGDHHNRGHSSQMRVPRSDSLSWRGGKKVDNRPMREADAAIVRAAASTFNKFAGDGSFLKSFEADGRADRSSSRSAAAEKPSVETPGGGQASTSDSFEVVYEPARPFQKLADDLEKRGSSGGDDGDEDAPPPAKPAAALPRRMEDGGGGGTSGLSANQVAAKAMKLRLSGKAKEADELLVCCSSWNLRHGDLIEFRLNPQCFFFSNC